MNRVRYSIAALMGGVLFLALGFAALRNANPFWASATLTLVVALVAAAPVLAIARRGRARMAWAGFAAFGWACLLIGLSRPQLAPAGGGGFRGGMGGAGLLTSEPLHMEPLLVEWGLARLHPHIRPGGPRVVRVWIDPSYRHVSRSLEVIVFGLVGAALGYFLVAGNEDRQ